MGVVQDVVEKKLFSKLEPQHMEVINDSHKHSVPKGSESHFSVIVVSEKFVGLSRIERQRLVFKVLNVELDGLIHALSMKLHTKSEWDSLEVNTHTTPDCLGGSKWDPLSQR